MMRVIAIAAAAAAIAISQRDLLGSDGMRERKKGERKATSATAAERKGKERKGKERKGKGKRARKKIQCIYIPRKRRIKRRKRRIVIYERER